MNWLRIDPYCSHDAKHPCMSMTSNLHLQNLDYFSRSNKAEYPALPTARNRDGTAGKGKKRTFMA